MTEPRDHLSLPMTEWTDTEKRQHVDDHIVMALEAADSIMFGDRQRAEDYVRDRLVAMSDTYPDAEGIAAHRKDRANRRILRAIGLRIP